MKFLRHQHDVIFLRRDVKKWVLVWLGCATFIPMTHFAGYNTRLWVVGYWVGMFVWPVGFLISTIQLLPRSASLILDGEGITITKAFRKRHIAWHECSNFKVWRYVQPIFFGISKTEMIVFSTGKTGPLVRFNKALSGEDDYLPGTYGMSAEALCNLLIELHKKYTVSVD